MEEKTYRSLFFFFAHKIITSAVKRVESVDARMSYTILRGCLCHIIVLNIHSPTEDKSVSIRNLNVYSINSLNTNFTRIFQCQSKQGRHFQTDNCG
jgi:hypothetical protein